MSGNEGDFSAGRGTATFAVRVALLTIMSGFRPKRTASAKSEDHALKKEISRFRMMSPSGGISSAGLHAEGCRVVVNENAGDYSVTGSRGFVPRY